MGCHQPDLWVLGVDPGAVAGWALVHLERGRVQLHLYGEVGRRDVPCTGDLMLEVIRQAVEAAGGVPWLAVEGQFIPGRGGAGQAERAQAVDALETARQAGGWRCIGEAEGLPLYSRGGVQPATWRAGVYGRGGPRLHTREQKARAVEVALQVHGVKLPASRHHMAEAIHLATWCAEELQHRAALLERGIA